MSEDGDIDLYSILTGFKWLLKQLYLQVALDEEIPDMLERPRRFIELIASKGYKNLKLSEAFFGFLQEIGVLVLEGDRYSWYHGELGTQSKGKSILEQEAVSQRLVQQKAMPLFGILKSFAERLPNVLKGEPGSREDELAIWDSLYGTDLYEFLRKEAITHANIPENSLILDIGCRTGWSTINLIELTNPKKVIALDSNEAMLELAYENIVTAGYQDKVQLIVGDLRNKINFSKKFDVVFSNLYFNRIEDLQLTDILFNLAPLMVNRGLLCGLQPIKSDDNVGPAELLLYSDIEFKGYPTFFNFYTNFEKAGFIDLEINKSMFFKCRLSGAREEIELKKKKK
ncbi:MAG: class I SAM-dependent methyltransferase [Candidatus Lokiarchaeota archaeon]|nr:class I SAM-dependent methyltransferase [Candidatus Lokiarchaeota archaeon]